MDSTNFVNNIDNTTVRRTITSRHTVILYYKFSNATTLNFIHQTRETSSSQTKPNNIARKPSDQRSLIRQHSDSCLNLRSKKDQHPRSIMELRKLTMKEHEKEWEDRYEKSRQG